MKLEIRSTPGTRAKGDRIYLITTKKDEPITAFKLALVINQIAVNEIKLKPWLDLKRDELYFKELIVAAIEDAKRNVDWSNPNKEKYIVRLCNKYYIAPEKIDFDLLHNTQREFVEASKA